MPPANARIGFNELFSSWNSAQLQSLSLHAAFWSAVGQRNDHRLAGAAGAAAAVAVAGPTAVAVATAAPGAGTAWAWTSGVKPASKASPSPHGFQSFMVPFSSFCEAGGRCAGTAPVPN